jgi:3-hydroxymyristoyl/3-hydroxydecanoyl-(acyl carrier protein) dehydratase
MKAIGLENGRHVQRHVFPFPDAALSCRLSRMAVGTEDLTLCDLYEDRWPRETGFAHVGHIVALVAEMIEVEDDGVSLAAPDTRMLRQVLPHQQLVLVARLVSSRSDVCDVARPIALVPGALVFSHAAFAPGVTDAELWKSKAELIEGLLDAAFAADPRFHCVEHAFYRITLELGRADEATDVSARNVRARYFSHLTPRS